MNPKTAAKWLIGVAATVVLGLTASTAPSAADDDPSGGGQVERPGISRFDTGWD